MRHQSTARIIQQLFDSQNRPGRVAMTDRPEETAKGHVETAADWGKVVTREELRLALSECYPLNHGDAVAYRVTFLSSGKEVREVSWGSEGLVNHLCDRLGID
jgi:hypothetical protein